MQNPPYLTFDFHRAVTKIPQTLRLIKTPIHLLGPPGVETGSCAPLASPSLHKGWGRRAPPPPPPPREKRPPPPRGCSDPGMCNFLLERSASQDSFPLCSQRAPPNACLAPLLFVTIAGGRLANPPLTQLGGGGGERERRPQSVSELRLQAKPPSRLDASPLSKAAARGRAFLDGD